MPNEEKNSSVTISKNNSGFPEYLDFDKLRSEGIAYLGKLSGKIWTDHNVHDPGITIFEELCYALLDLGYRTNLPVEDLLARNPSDNSQEDNFFTPAEILTCNPLTINDYRKLLMDIPGVRNAWLEPAVDIKNICNKRLPVPVDHFNDPLAINADSFAPTAVAPSPTDVACDEFLNGLYHVYIETEKDIDKDFYDDDPQKEKEARDEYAQGIITKVRKALMAHRNLCEDFEDIYILCKLETGVCASIELKEGADAENVYVEIANKLNDFFSPTPRFYTLPQLLEKGKSIEEIFAGRPYSSASHGFIDTNELENIILRKEIHTSDVYNAIFQVEGVKRVSKLCLRDCGKKCTPTGNQKNSYWRNHLPENHVPVFSIACSGFEFTRNGMAVSVDTEKFSTQLELDRLHTGKVLIQMPSLNLDLEIPKGVYHKDLDNYLSIQNDFPVAYGIGDGHLPEGISDKRKAWALQLKGYLFFFDQMLGNYLSQLKNIRQLFSLRHPTDKKDQHTYFLNTIATVPEINKLLRFSAGDTGNNLGTNGTLLVQPVEKKEWEKINTRAKLAEEILESQKPFHFSSLFELYEATDLLRNDLVHDGESLVRTYMTADECWLYTIESSASDYILLSKKISATEAAAMQHAASVQYTGVFENNYRSYLTADNRFTFNIELNIDSYTDYLGILVENDELYSKRRKDFLTHLLSRFAEQFTDFVLLNWKPGQESTNIETAERFLTNYADISRNRGRAWDYLTGGWRNDNISGFEKKVKALAGMPQWGKNHLCHFTVEPYDEQYILNFSKAGAAAFEVHEKFDLLDEAREAARSLIGAMKNVKNYQPAFVPATKQYQLLLQYGAERPAVYPLTFTNSIDAENLSESLSNVISQKPPANAVYEHSWIWSAVLKNRKNKIVKTSVETWHSAEVAKEGIKRLSSAVNDNNIWKPDADTTTIELFPAATEESRFIDIEAFNIDINATIIRKPGRYTYDVLDKATNSFRLSPADDFSSRPEAREHCCKILGAAVTESNFVTPRNKRSNQYRVELQIEGKTEAISDTEYETKTEAWEAVKHIIETIKEYSYTLELEKDTETWKFHYRLGYHENDSFLFTSREIYSLQKKAEEAAAIFHENVEGLVLKKTAGDLSLVHKKNKDVANVVYVSLEGQEIPEDAIHQKLEEHQEMVRMANAVKPEELRSYVAVDGPQEYGTFVYRLVNKNRVPALYTGVFGSEQESWDKRKPVAAASKKAIRTIPQICLGGDIFSEVYDDENNKQYRYQVKLHHADWVQPGENETVLFESVMGYSSAGEAGKAFLQNYPHLLKLASDANAYGKTISTTPVALPAKDACSSNELIAFIPAKTLKLLEDRFGMGWKVELSKYIGLYPIKIIDADSKEFALLFCKSFENKPGTCSNKEIKWVYYFSLSVPEDIKHKLKQAEWRSTSYFDTPDAAMQEFLYFSRLLKYTGNYFVDCACTKTIADPKQVKGKEADSNTSYSYKIFIHEVLAQSINWYRDKDLAWEGIEKFICAVQEGNAFKNYLRSEDCCFSFYVTCGNGLLEHPCKYDTALQRDKALEALHKHFLEYNQLKSYSHDSNGGNINLTNHQGKPFAQLITSQSGTSDDCDFYIGLAEAIIAQQGTISYQDDGHLVYTIGNGQIVIKSTDQKIATTESEKEAWKAIWKKMLHNWACYFPIVRSKVKTATNKAASRTRLYKYCIELKLPGFNLCNEELDKPCDGCSDQSSKNPEANCYVAWKSVCCYATCSEAMEALEKATRLLSDKTVYHPVFDCDCNSFGITLHTNNPVLVQDKDTKVLSDIIAVNPQCYETPNEVCRAVDTAYSLVNSQGLHLAEHILLRPHVEEDCRCRDEWRGCGFECNFPHFISEGAGACAEEDRHICFKPGSDPYSFIATAILPAWTNRFRDEANRNAIEMILYREAPAHVLLRILWLKPRDFCRFETAFKQWSKSMTGENTCDNDFSVCKFLDLLIGTEYDCLDDCVPCMPCSDPVETKPLNCVEEEKKSRKAMIMKYRLTGGVLFSRLKEPNGFLNQVNKIFCFKKYCDHTRKSQPHIAIEPKEMSVALISQPAIKKESRPEVKLSKQPAKTDQPAEKKSAIRPESLEEIKLKAQFINARLDNYKTVVKSIQETSNANPLADKLDSFLKTPGPDIVRLEKLVTEVIRNEKPTKKKAKLLNKDQQQQIIKAAVCFYLDKVCFNGKDKTLINKLEPVVAQMSKIKMDGQAIYGYWKPKEVIKYEPDIDVDFIKRVLSGTKK